MHWSTRPRCATIRRSRPRLEPLEGRDVPAGHLAAALSAGVLTLTGDDDSNVVTLTVTGADVTLTPDGATAVNDGGAGEAVTLPGAATALRAALKGGNDTLAIDGAADLVLPGGARVDLGDGDNTLGWTTDGKIELGSLAVVGGDGTDTVTVDAGAGLGKVAGPATFDGRLGSHFVTLQDLEFPGPAGVVVKGVGGRSGGVLTVGTVTTAGPLVVGLGNSQVECMVTDSTLGRLVAPANRGILNVDLTRSAVQGDVALKGGSAALVGAQSSVGGKVTIAALSAGILANDVTVAGNVTLTGVTVAGIGADGPFSARKVFVSSPTGGANFSANGPTTAVTVEENMVVIGGPGGVVVSFSTGALSEVKGDLTVTGGRLADQFGAGLRFRVDGNLTLNLGGDDNTVTIGGANLPVEIGRDLAIRTGDGNDAIALNFLTVGGATRVTTGAGADTLTVDQGADFAGTFLANLGAGDDLIAIAQSVGSPRPVRFTSTATVLGSAGNDTLQLGNAGGDANSLAQFFGAGNVFDGGLNLNWFDDEAQLVAHPATATLTLTGWTDPTP